MDSTEAIRAAIEMIQNAIDDDSLTADQAYAQEVITQLQHLLDDQDLQPDAS